MLSGQRDVNRGTEFYSPIRPIVTFAIGAVGAALLAACSPYAFTDGVQTLSAKMASIDSAYQTTAQTILSEQRLSNRLIWVRDKPILLPGPGCSPDSDGSLLCHVITSQDAASSSVKTAPTVADAGGSEQISAAASVCEEASTPAGPMPTAGTIKPLKPLQRADLLNALDNYTAALAALTKAADRTDFDSAAGKAGAAVGGLAQSAATVSGVGTAEAPLVGTLAKASSNAALWLVGQELDYQRLRQLRITTRAACAPIHTLAAALGVVLEGQRGDRLDGLHKLLILKVQAANIARSTPHVTEQVYGAAIDDAQAAADTFQSVAATNPKAAAQALADAHDALVKAVRDNDGQFTAMAASLQQFIQRADELTAAAKPAVGAAVTKP